MKINWGEGKENSETILWRSILLPGHEACRLVERNLQWQLDGTAVFSHEETPCLLCYEIICDWEWHTLSARVKGWRGEKNVSIKIKTDPDHNWWLNGVEVAEVKGCIDVDLNFSPSTNLIAVRRLKLKVGEKAEITAAWLKYPGFGLEPLPQSYERSEDLVYRYTSNNGQFTADLRVNEAGFAIDYPGIWVAEVGTP
jgi:hypothetical protein